jgi:alpha-beta hydrolase superfamily lysophospholipase
MPLPVAGGKMQKWYSLTVSFFTLENPKNARMLHVSQMPAENTGNTLHVNGIDLYYETQGAGEPLLLLHGGSGSHEDWAYAGRDEFVRDYSLIMPDARGHGARQIPPRRSRTVNAPMTRSLCSTISASRSAKPSA